ncbi:MAG: EF2563 family selenium-dependent molybdenum hydroxylase system protein [Dethiobacter sp.]|nr:MAG: EF2563 family selenium-dependent molybdenum hydroxylase system protein [Dethiobacter sp.]
MKFPFKVLIKGAGDLASGVAHRLWKAGFNNMVMLELPEPLVVRHSVAFASAVYKGTMQIEGVEARICREIEDIGELWKQRVIPVCIDPEGMITGRFSPDILIDAIMAKKNTGTSLKDAAVVIGLGPGFVAGKDAHAVIETKRGHNLGKAIYAGCAAANTGVPGEVGGFGRERLLRAPASGKFVPLKEIGELVQKGQVVATVEGVPIIAEISGLLRGMLFPGLEVQEGMKVGDIDPRGKEIDCDTISDKARAVAGGVLEAILHLHPGFF